jgi:hypothetical protein
VFVINGCWINVYWRSWVIEIDTCNLMLIFYQKSCLHGGAYWNDWISHLCKIIWCVAIFHIQALLVYGFMKTRQFFLSCKLYFFKICLSQ